LPFIDVTPAFMAHPEPKSLTAYPGKGRGSHYSPIGYGVVGKVVLDHFLKERSDMQVH